MKAPRIIAWLAIFIGIGGSWLRMPSRAAVNEMHPELPAVLQDGFRQWKQKGVIYALDLWQKGGLLEGDRKVDSLSDYFKRLDRVIGNYRSYELIETRHICPSSQIVYVAIEFDHASVYGRFLVYQTAKDWVVQNMDFSPKPETLMPWLAFGGVNYTE